MYIKVFCVLTLFCVSTQSANSDLKYDKSIPEQDLEGAYCNWKNRGNKNPFKDPNHNYLYCPRQMHQGWMFLYDYVEGITPDIDHFGNMGKTWIIKDKNDKTDKANYRMLMMGLDLSISFSTIWTNHKKLDDKLRNVNNREEGCLHASKTKSQYKTRTNEYYEDKTQCMVYRKYYEWISKQSWTPELRYPILESDHYKGDNYRGSSYGHRISYNVSANIIYHPKEQGSDVYTKFSSPPNPQFLMYYGDIIHHLGYSGIEVITKDSNIDLVCENPIPFYSDSRFLPTQYVKCYVKNSRAGGDCPIGVIDVRTNSLNRAQAKYETGDIDLTLDPSTTMKEQAWEHFRSNIDGVERTLVLKYDKQTKKYDKFKEYGTDGFKLTTIITPIRHSSNNIKCAIEIFQHYDPEIEVPYKLEKSDGWNSAVYIQIWDKLDITKYINTKDKNPPIANKKMATILPYFDTKIPDDIYADTVIYKTLPGTQVMDGPDLTKDLYSVWTDQSGMVKENFEMYRSKQNTAFQSFTMQTGTNFMYTILCDHNEFIPGDKQLEIEMYDYEKPCTGNILTKTKNIKLTSLSNYFEEKDLTWSTDSSIKNSRHWTITTKGDQFRYNSMNKTLYYFWASDMGIIKKITLSTVQNSKSTNNRHVLDIVDLENKIDHPIIYGSKSITQEYDIIGNLKYYSLPGAMGCSPANSFNYLEKNGAITETDQIKLDTYIGRNEITSNLSQSYSWFWLDQPYVNKVNIKKLMFDLHTPNEFIGFPSKSIITRTRATLSSHNNKIVPVQGFEWVEHQVDDKRFDSPYNGIIKQDVYWIKSNINSRGEAFKNNNGSINIIDFTKSDVPPKSGIKAISTHANFIWDKEGHYISLIPEQINSPGRNYADLKVIVHTMYVTGHQYQDIYDFSDFHNQDSSKGWKDGPILKDSDFIDKSKSVQGLPIFSWNKKDMKEQAGKCPSYPLTYTTSCDHDNILRDGQKNKVLCQTNIPYWPGQYTFKIKDSQRSEINNIIEYNIIEKNTFFAFELYLNQKIESDPSGRYDMEFVLGTKFCTSLIKTEFVITLEWSKWFDASGNLRPVSVPDNKTINSINDQNSEIFFTPKYPGNFDITRKNIGEMYFMNTNYFATTQAVVYWLVQYYEQNDKLIWTGFIPSFVKETDKKMAAKLKYKTVQEMKSLGFDLTLNSDKTEITKVTHIRTKDQSIESKLKMIRVSIHNDTELYELNMFEDRRPMDLFMDSSPDPKNKIRNIQCDRYWIQGGDWILNITCNPKSTNIDMDKLRLWANDKEITNDILSKKIEEVKDYDSSRSITTTRSKLILTLDNSRDQLFNRQIETNDKFWLYFKDSTTDDSTFRVLREITMYVTKDCSKEYSRPWDKLNEFSKSENTEVKDTSLPCQVIEPLPSIPIKEYWDMYRNEWESHFAENVLKTNLKLYDIEFAPWYRVFFMASAVLCIILVNLILGLFFA